MADSGKGRSYSPGNFTLDIDGYNVSYLKKFSGLSMHGDVVTNDMGPDNVQKKHIANIKWSAGKASIGIGMGKGMYDWIRLSFDKAYVPKNGSFTETFLIPTMRFFGSISSIASTRRKG